MECKSEVVMAGGSADVAAVVTRTLYPLPTLRMTSASAANGQVPSWMAEESAGTDALISVWWDYYPPN
jgi:hypothetical protein